MVTGNIKVLLVDDHEVVRAGYRRLIDSANDIEVLDEVANGEEAYSHYFKQQPDVVVMDITMPGMGGLEASRRILSRDKSARVVIFSVHDNEVYLRRALEIGVKGYITKRSAPKVMIDAIRQVAKGEIFVGQDMMTHLVNYTMSDDQGAFGVLSPREFEVFLMLAEGKTVLETADILNLSPKTVGHHYTSIKTKLDISSPSELTRLAIRNGLLEA